MKKSRTGWTVALIVAAVLFLLIPLLKLNVSPHKYEGGRSRNMYDRAKRNRSAPGIILGEIRASMSDVMFIKTERYLHSGVAYKLELDYDALSSKGQVKDKAMEEHDDHEHEGHAHEHAGHDHDHEHEELPDEESQIFKCQGADTVIKTREKDFRGFIGDLHRQVKPWIDPTEPHMHTKGKELIPWYRMMTWSDPHHVRGYMIGAWWLKRHGDEDQLKEAISFLQEGIDNNPNAYQLFLMKGRIQRQLGQNREAKESYKKAADLAIRQRPPGGKTGPDWTYYKEEDALASIRLAVFAEREYGSKQKALELGKKYLNEIKQDAILERVVRELEEKVG